MEIAVSFFSEGGILYEFSYRTGIFGCFTSQ